MSTDGQQAGGIVGFLNSLRHLVEMTMPESVYVVWEGGGSSRRRTLFPEYKAGRKPPRLNRYYEDDIPDSKENRMHQIKVLVETLKSLPVCQLFIEDCEADDVIGYLCRNCFRDKRKLIASSDRDFYQLVDQMTMIYSWASKKFIGFNEVIAEFEISPENFVLAKAVCGDASDAIPGVKGVGFKSLVKRFDLKNALVSLPDLMKLANDGRAQSDVKIYAQICENESLIKRNWRLMYLDSTNLAASQIRKIEAVVDSFKPTKNKIQLMRTLLDEGLGAYDSHELFSAFSIV